MTAPSPLPAPHCPKPLRGLRAVDIDQSTLVDAALARLEKGEWLRVRDAYATGTRLLAALRRRYPAAGPRATHRERPQADAAYRAVAGRVVVPVRGKGLGLAKAPPVGFLPLLYGTKGGFDLPLLDVQALNGAYQTYKEGVAMPVLGGRIHPFYATYVPRRMEHLVLFTTWLSGYSGLRERAVDVGTGTGILALLLAKAGFAQVTATDVNPNAVISVHHELERRSPRPAVVPVLGDLLDPVPERVDLIVFNPPWMQGDATTFVDRAMYFTEGLFERFFAQAHQRLRPQGRVVLVFSNVVRLVQPDVPHPIEAELAKGRFHVVQKLERRIRPQGKGRRTRERVEVWELAPRETSGA